MKPPAEIIALDDKIAVMIALTETLGNQAGQREALEDAIFQTRALMLDRAKLVNLLRAENWPDCRSMARWSERENKLAKNWLPWAVRRGKLRIYPERY